MLKVIGSEEEFHSSRHDRIDPFVPLQKYLCPTKSDLDIQALGVLPSPGGTGKILTNTGCTV